MFIELADALCCPEDHPEAYCVLTPQTMADRNVVTGTVGCPICKREYEIADGIVGFGEPPERDVSGPVPDPSAVHALLGVSTPGGYALLVGSVARLADTLVTAIGGVHVVAVNPPPDVRLPASLSVLRSPTRIPLRASTMRGVALGAEHAAEPWFRECARVLMPSARLVIAREIDEVSGVRRLAVGEGMYVGEKA